MIRNLMSGFCVLVAAVLVGCASTPAAVGVWDVELNTPLGAMPATLTINEDGTGSMAAEGMGSSPLSGIMFDGNMVAFDAEIDAQGQTIFLEFSGNVEGDSMTGEFGSDFGAFGVTGSRE